MADEGNVYELLRRDNRLPRGPQPPDNDQMDARVKALEDFATAARERLARIEATMATKSDVSDLRAELHKALNEQTWKVIGVTLTFGTLLSAAVFFIARHVK